MTPEAADAPLLIRREGAVLTLTLNRPHRLNGLTGEVVDGLADALEVADDADEVRVVVLTGAGRAFCAGADLRDMASSIDDQALDVGDYLHRHYVPVIKALQALRKPVIAAVNGVAAGAGLSLALACDLRIAAASARFVQAFVRIGLVPDAGSTYFLPRAIGSARAMEMSLLGDEVDAPTAAAWGLVNRVVPDDELLAVTRALAERLARGPASLRLIKTGLSRSHDHTLEEQMALEEDLQRQASVTADFPEGVRAFVEHRTPEFTGR